MDETATPDEQALWDKSPTFRQWLLRRELTKEMSKLASETGKSISQLWEEAANEFDEVEKLGTLDELINRQGPQHREP